MCLIFLSYKQHKEYPLIILANRDEFYKRPTLAADYWKENPNILAGKDLEGGGTWMGVTKNGYLAMLTNYRDIANIKPNAPTRGKLVSDYLQGEFNPKEYLKALSKTGSSYNGYSLIAGNFNDPWYYSNYGNKIAQLGTGLYGLSNALLDSKWPKVETGKAELAPLLSKTTLDKEALFNVMTNQQKAEKNNLPNTGLSIEKERAISPRFINTEDYGTRCTTLITVSKEGIVDFTERQYSNGIATREENHYSFRVN